MKSRGLADIREFISINGRLFVAMGFAVAALMALQTYTSSDKKECMGVVDLKETNIAFDTSVIVKNIFVLPGQKVKQGQALLEVKPVETTIKLLELNTQLDNLMSEKAIVDSLFSERRQGGKKAMASPLDSQIEGLKKQISELETSMKQAVRFAESDGTIGSVNFRVSEQVPPFQPVITLNSSEPSLVYGFIHEDRLSDFQLGETVRVESLNRKGKLSMGNVVSLGNRITQFPERLTGNPQIQYWGREIVVSLPGKNQFLPGEKVRLLAHESERLPFLQILKAVAVEDENEHPKVIAYDLPFEASGLIQNPHSNDELIVVSDDLNKANGSPFWNVNLIRSANSNHIPVPTNLPLDKKGDWESLARDGDRLFALGSLSSDKKGKDLIVFHVDKSGIQLEQVISFRKPFLSSLKIEPFLRNLTHRLYQNAEVEGFAVKNGEAFLALKQPFFDDGSSVLIKVANFHQFVESGGEIPLTAEVVSPLHLNSESCGNSSRITDLAFFDEDLLILTNCKNEPISQVWVYKLQTGPAYPGLLKTLDIPRLESLAVSHDKSHIFLGDDNGNQGVSTIFKSPIVKSW